MDLSLIVVVVEIIWERDECNADDTVSARIKRLELIIYE